MSSTFKSIDCIEVDNGQRYEIDVTIAARDVKETIDEFYALLIELKHLSSICWDEAIRMLEELMGKENLVEACRDYVLNHFTALAVRQVGVDYVLVPGVHADGYPANDEDYSYSISLTPRPHLSLTSIEPVHIAKEEIEVEESDILEQLDYTARQFVTYRSIDKAELTEGDYAIMDVDMAVEGKPLKKLSGVKRFVEVKKGLVPLGFIEGVSGMVVDETRAFDFDVPGILGTAPEAYSARVTLRDIQEEVVPVIDDAFVAKNLQQFETLEGFRCRIREDLEEQKERVEKQDYVVRIREALEKRLQGVIPDEMYEEARESLMASVLKKIESQDSSLEEYCEAHSITEDAFNMNVFIQASGYLKQNLALDLLAKARGLNETEEEVSRAKAGLDSATASLSDEDFEKRGLRKALGEQIRREKAMKWLCETAVVD